MWTLCGILSFIILTFPNNIELLRKHKNDAVHPMPFTLNLTNFEGVVPARPGPQRGTCFVGTHIEMGQHYIIGVIVARGLREIVTPRALNYNNRGRVKVHIDGDVAEIALPISREDPLNDLFDEPFGPANIRYAWLS